MNSQFDRLTQKSQEAIQAAVGLAQQKRSASFEPEHLLSSVASDAGGLVAKILERLNVSLSTFQNELTTLIGRLPRVEGSAARLEPSSRLTKLLQRAETEAQTFQDTYISTEHFLLGALKMGDSNLAALFKKLKVDYDDVLPEIQKLRAGKKIEEPGAEDQFEVLQKYARDLTQIASEGKLDPVVGRDEEIRRVIQVLSRRTKNNPVLIGEPGVGKTAIAEGLALRIVHGDVPEHLLGKKLMSLDLGALIAGAKYRGEFEDRLKAVIKEVTSGAGEIILFIDELHTLVGAGKTDGAMDAGQLLKPALARGELRCIGATTLDEYRKYIEKDAALERRFQIIVVDEPTVDEAITILRGLKERYELHHGVKITDSAIVAAVKLSHRYIPARFLPDKAIDLMDEAASKLSIESKSVPEEVDVLERELMQLRVEREALIREKDDAQVSERLALVEKQIGDLAEKSKTLRAQWEKEKAGLGSARDLKKQIEATKAAIEKAERNFELERAAELKYGVLPQLQKQMIERELGTPGGKESKMLQEEVRPEDIAEVVAKWTGIPVNKMLETETEKLLTMETKLKERVVGQDHALTAVADAIRRSRAEISDPHRPMGSFLFLGPTGVGKTETAKALAEFLFDSEQSLVRIDMSEYMEKHSVARLIGAPPGYVGFEEGGQLTEIVRRKPYCVILLDEIEKAHPDVFHILLQVMDDGRLTDGQGRTVDFRNTLLIMTSNLKSENLKSFFRPEFLNRVDDIVHFESLSENRIGDIVRVQLQVVRKRLEQKKIHLEFSNEVIQLLSDRGFEPDFGARPLKRAIQNFVLNPLAKQMISGHIKAGQRVRAETSSPHFRVITGDKADVPHKDREVSKPEVHFVIL